MAITTFATLKTYLAAASDRTDLTSCMGDFVRRAHDIIVTEVVISSDLTVDAASETLPTDFRVAQAVTIDAWPRVVLTASNADQMENYGTGVPSLYRVSSQTIYFAPTPDETYYAKVLYKCARTAFSADADYNTILTRYPFVYVWGALAELFSYILDTENAALNEQKFRAEIARINAIETEDALNGPLQVTPGTSYGIAV